MPRCIEDDPYRGIGGSIDGGVMGRFYKQCRDGMKLGIVVTNQGGGSGVKRALRRSGGDGVGMGGGIHPLHVSLAIMRSVAATADRKVRLGVRREREERRYQRKAEEQQQRKCQKASHDSIVVDGSAAFVRRSGMSGEYFSHLTIEIEMGSRTKRVIHQVRVEDKVSEEA